MDRLTHNNTNTCTFVSNIPSDAADNPAITNSEIPVDESREKTHDVISAILNGVATRNGAAAAAPGVRTRAVTKTAPSSIAAWASPTLINSRQHCRAAGIETGRDG
ncbi:hypothetical protein F441_10188 [Phytophthora nicotianae CJ01A1]|uniref:Uncharacterized protein n=1 Tax=Phytophthora nicotianae CJ01A1 TaxID=1317063 RepID=W2WWM2_PHYNI|nr:hypothetical protein F441_10188 [Phytophthora nicotianae CJ01A1]